MKDYPKRLIESDLPIKLISQHARREKSLRHGHISPLHTWWARRPLAACRAILCAALWPDPVDQDCPPDFSLAVARILREFAKKVVSDHTLIELCSRHFKDWECLALPPPKTNWRCCPNMRRYLLIFIADFARWDASTHPVFLETARALTQAAHESLGGIPGTNPLVVDPFAGGGAIPLEALRVGADTFASDLNPVAVLLNKIVLEYIPKYGQRLADEVRKWGNWIKEQAEQELAAFYPRDPDGAIPIVYLWARTIICEGPGCGAEVPLLRSFWLAKKNNKAVALRLIPNLQQKCVDFAIITDAQAGDIREGTVRRGSAQCPVCGYTTPVASVRRQLKERCGGSTDARLFAVVTTRPGEQGRFYRLPTPEDREAVQRAEAELRRRKIEHQGPLSLIPDEPTPSGGGSGAGRAFSQRNYGMNQFKDLFTPRQLLVLTTLTKLIKEVDSRIAQEHDPAFATVVQSILACALNREAEHSSALCRWNPSGQKLQATFGHQTLRMLWDFCETNVFGGSVGSWDNIMECILIPFATMQNVNNGGSVVNVSATKHPLSDNAAQIFATDPPYYDAVPYADLSDFFYVWFKRTIGDKYPDLLAARLTPKDDECVVDEVKGHDKAFFEHMMSQAMGEGCRILAPGGICVVVFAHKSTTAWEAQLQAMVDAGWIITGSWPIDTEMGTRLRALDSAALASSIHLVCRPRKNPDGSPRTDDVGDWRDVLQELPIRVQTWMSRLASEGIVGADAIFSCLGPAIEIFSRYSHVERADGERVTLKEYLEYVWAAVSREALHTIFQGADTSDFEPDARLTAIWLWTLSTRDEKNGIGNEKTQQPVNGTHTLVKEATAEYLVDEEEEEEETAPRPGINGYAIEFDTARKLAQGLGAHLDKVTTLVEIKGGIARLRSLHERARFLFAKGADGLSLAKPRKRAKMRQLSMFQEQELVEEFAGIAEIPAFNLGSTVLDRLHQAMLLYGMGDTDALRNFLQEEGAGTDPRFWQLAVALTRLYPPDSDEQRWVDGVQRYKKG